jgi:hypothetical protein
MTYDKLKKHIKSFPKLPRKFFVRFALYCANDVKHLMNKESLRVLEVMQLWLEGKATEQEVKDAADFSYTNIKDTAAYTAAFYAADAAAYAAYAAFYAAYAADAAFYAAYHSSYAANKDEQKFQQYYNKFNEMLNELSEIEKVICL